MSFELPNLDTATFWDIQTQLVRRIPQFTGRWTDHNDSDPGITLLQLLSWLGESLLWQANAIPIETQANFLRWVLGLPLSNTAWPYATAAKTQYDFAFLELQSVLARIEAGEALSADALQVAVSAFIASPYVALTLSDTEALALQTNRVIDAKEAAKPTKPTPARVARADAAVIDEAVVVRILSDTTTAYTYPAPGNNTGTDGTCHALLLRQAPGDPVAVRSREQALIDAVAVFLAPRVMLGSAVTVRPARRTDIDVTAVLRCPANVDRKTVLNAVISVLVRVFEPTAGWVYDQSPDVAAIQHLVADVPGVASIDSFTLTYVPTIRLPDMAWLGADTLLGDLPMVPPALTYSGLPRVRCLNLSAMGAP